MAGSGKDGRDAARARKAGCSNAERNVARRAKRAEEHARLINERQGSNEFPWRERNPDGSESIHLPEHVVGLLREQRQLFVEKFGREPGAGDPIFFDPEADTPLEISPEQDLAEFRDICRRAGVDDSYADAYEEVGYLVTDLNRHMFSLEEIDAFLAALDRSRNRRA